MRTPLVRLGSVLASGLVVFAGVAGLSAAPASASLPIDHLVIAPSNAEITAGGSQDYTAEAFDADNDDLGDVTADTTFTITPDGNCTGATCTATVAGPHTVTGTDGSATGSASLTVDAAPLDHLVLAPDSAEITAGGSQDYTAEGFDQYDNDLGDVTADTVFTITPDGNCTGTTCTATLAGPHTVTGTDGSATGSTALTVDPGPLSQLVATATPAAVKPGVTVTITVEGFDQYGNDLGDETSLSTIGISTGASCVQNECYSFNDGTYAITAKIGAVTGNTSFQVGARQGITFPKPPHAQLSAGTTTVSATASSGLDVTFTSSTPSVCTTGGTDGATITLLTTGVCTLVANQGGDTSYLPAHFRKKNFRVV